MRCPRAALLGLAVIAVAAIGGEAATQTPSQACSVQALVANGQKVFEGTCSNQYCHGTGGAGAQGPRLIDHPMSPEIVRSAIHDGRSGTPMLPFKDILEPPQLEAVIAYVLSISSGVKCGSVQCPLLLQNEFDFIAWVGRHLEAMGEIGDLFKVRGDVFRRGGMLA